MLVLPSKLTIAQVEEYSPEVQQCIDINSEITLDDSKLETVDTIGIQFILSIITTIAAQGKILKFESKSKALQESVKRLGINDAILIQHFPS